MKYQDIQDALATLARLSYQLEDLYIDSEGEVTEETEAMEARIDALKDLLQNDGIDALGRWLKTKEDEVKMWKAERDAAIRKQKSTESTISFVKSMIAEILKATGMDKAKGKYYGFSAYTSEKTTVNTDELDRLYLDIARAAAHDAGLPEWVDITLKTTATAAREAGAEEFLDTTTADAVRFTKPRTDR